MGRFKNGPAVDVQPMTPEIEDFLEKNIRLENHEERFTKEDADKGFKVVMEEQGEWYQAYLKGEHKR